MFPNMPGNGPPGEEYKCSYYFDDGNCRFISILSDWEDRGVRVDQKRLDQILDASSGFEHIVFGHHQIRDLGGVEGAFWRSLVAHSMSMPISAATRTSTTALSRGIATTWQVIVGTAGAPSFPPLAGLTGTPISDQYGFAMVDVDGPTAA